MLFHIACGHGAPDAFLRVRRNYCDQIPARTSLSKHGPASFFDATTPATDDPGRITILVNDFFDFFRIYVMQSYMLNVVFIPLRIQFPKSHVRNVA